MKKPPLQIDEDLYREWLLLYFDRMRDLENQVIVYRTAIEILKQQVDAGNQTQLIDRLVQGIRDSKDVKDVLDEKYSRYRAQSRKGHRIRPFRNIFRNGKQKAP